MAITSPTTTLHPLNRASGSATFSPASTPSLTVLAAVHSPLEVSRRDELPEEAYIDVHVRSATNSSGTPRERRLEHVLANLLRRVVLVEKFPRQVVRVTLQVLGEEVEGRGSGTSMGGIAGRDARLLPSLVNAAVLALIDAAAPLACVCVAACAAVGLDGKVVVLDSAQVVRNGCRSLHAMTFTAKGALILEESVGDFGMEDREEVRALLKTECVGGMKMTDADKDAAMEGTEGESGPWLRRAVEEKIRSAGAWKEDG